jgi:flagellar assembly factor FliW
MEINSKLFGSIEYTQENIISFEEGLIGIPEKKRFILIEKEDFKPFSYLQSVDDGTFILVVINPMLVVKEYKFGIFKDDLNAIDLSENDTESFSLLAIVILSNKIENVTVNLRAPIVINIHSKAAKQVLLQNDDYSVEEPLIQVSSPGSINFTAQEKK